MRFANLLTEKCQENLEYTPIVTLSKCLEAVVSGDVDLAVVPVENSTNGAVSLTSDSIRDLVHNADSSQDRELVFSSSSSPDDDKSNILPLAAALNTNKLTVLNEIFVPIQHCLISFAPSLENVSRLYTHPQAWGQVTNFTNRELPEANGIPRVDANSTSGAVAIVAKEMKSRKEKESQNDDSIDNTKESGNTQNESNIRSYPAAIASRAAAKVHNVPILVPDISNLTTNTTRFLVFARKGFSIGALEYTPEQQLQQQYAAAQDNTKNHQTLSKSSVPALSASSTLTSSSKPFSPSSSSNANETNNTKSSGPANPNSPSTPAEFVTLISLTTSHTEPGSLCTCLQAFASRGINLTSINSRPAYNPSFKFRNDASETTTPSPANPRNWQYVFFVEFHGNMFWDKKVKEAIEEVKKNCVRTTVFGSFPRAPEYYGYNK